MREVASEIEARLIAGRLLADGVPAVVLSQVDTTRNFTVGALAVAKVFVPRDRLEEARMLLDLPLPPESDQPTNSQNPRDTTHPPNDRRPN